MGIELAQLLAEVSEASKNIDQHDAASKRAELRERRAENDCELRQADAELRRRNGKPPHDDFICKCSAVIANPFDLEQIRLHQPHMHGL